MSQEYIASIAVILVGILKVFKIEIGSDVIVGLLTGILGLWIAIRRHQKGDINALGVKKS